MWSIRVTRLGNMRGQGHMRVGFEQRILLHYLSQWSHVSLNPAASCIPLYSPLTSVIWKLNSCGFNSSAFCNISSQRRIKNWVKDMICEATSLLKKLVD